MLFGLSDAHHAKSGIYDDHEIPAPAHAHNGSINPDPIFTKNFTVFEVVSAEAISLAPLVSNATTEVVGSTSPSLQPLGPALTSSAQITMTIMYISMFSLIFMLVYAQLWMIWYYRHKRLSHQTIFLFLCLIWAGLRTSLFSFYLCDCFTANKLNIALYCLLFSLPVCLQFCMLCLLLHFIIQVMLKAKAKYEPRQYIYPLHAFMGVSVLLYTSVNIFSAVMSRKYELATSSVPLYVIYIRVVVSEIMFFLYGVLLAFSLFKMAKMASTPRVLEAKGTTIRKAVVAAVLITLLFLSRALYNLISLFPDLKGTPNFGFDWINISDQADAIAKLPGTWAYVSFGVVLFIWEVLPISIVVILFRVKRLSAGQILTDFSTQNSGPRVFFFDNPRRYDSEDDLISQPSSSYVDSTGSHSYSSDSCFTRSSSVRTPVNSSLRAIISASPSLVNSPRLASSLPSNSPFLSFKRGGHYGALAGGGYVHTGPYSSRGVHSK